MMGKLRLTRQVTTEECPWLIEDAMEGDIVYRFQGPTYGAIEPGSIAVSDIDEDSLPFYELPADALVDVNG